MPRPVALHKVKSGHLVTEANALVEAMVTVVGAAGEGVHGMLLAALAQKVVREGSAGRLAAATSGTKFVVQATSLCCLLLWRNSSSVLIKCKPMS